MTNFNGRRIIAATDKPSSFFPKMDHGLVGTVLEAYLNHFNLILKPDDIWICIMTAFSRFIDVNAE